jgi:hypothetical protein
MPNGFEDQNQQGLNPVFQNIGAQQANLNQQIAQGNQMAQPQGRGASMSGLSPLAMAMALRKGAGNVAIPSADMAQMSGVSNMNGSMGTGLTQDAYNSGIGYNPMAQSDGYGMKF